MTAAETQSETRSDTTRPFTDRHIGVDVDAQAKMLAALGWSSLDALIDQAVPESIRLREPLALDRGRSEGEVLDELRALGAPQLRRWCR